MNFETITIEEADTFLEQFSDWIDLDDDVKTVHIRKASVYAQTQWVCSDVVWEDDPDTDDTETVDIPDEVKEAVAYYAYANFSGNLFGDPSVTEEPTRGHLKSTRDKVGSLSTEKSYYQSGAYSSAGTKSTLGYPDSLMRVYCVNSSTEIKLVRV